MEFINLVGPVKIRIGKANDCYWTTIKTGESVELSAEMGRHYGFSVKTTEGQIGNKKVETKQIDSVKDSGDFFRELVSIKGIGKKTARDIIRYAPTREILIGKIKTRDGLPFRDDHENLLREKYGRK